MKTATFILFTVFLLCSCNTVVKQVPSEEDLLRQELDSIDWKDVDEYPSFVECENIGTKELQKNCFFESLSKIVQEKLGQETVVLDSVEVYNINLRVTVSAEGKLKFKPQFPENINPEDTLKIDKVIKERLVDFPKINPAIKRWIPVKIEFVLPIVLKET